PRIVRCSPHDGGPFFEALGASGGPGQYAGLALRLSHMDRLPEAAISVVSWVCFEVNRVGQSVLPVEAVFFHYLDDAPALSRQMIGSTRPCGYARNVHGQACFVGRLAWRHSPEKPGMAQTASSARRAPIHSALIT